MRQKRRRDGAIQKGLDCGRTPPLANAAKAPSRRRNPKGIWIAAAHRRWQKRRRDGAIQSQQRACAINRLFHEDGAVWSLADARAVAAALHRVLSECRTARPQPTALARTIR